MARLTSTVTLADGRQVPIRQLGWLQARSSRQLRSVADQARHGQLMAALGGPEEFGKAWKAIRGDDTPSTGPAVPPVPVAPVVPMTLAESLAESLDDHDLLTVLICGIPTWTKAQIENDLDDPDPEILARAILALTLPRHEEPEGNAPGLSISA